MKKLRYFTLLILLFILSTQAVNSQTQGRIVINEYMPWTSNGCGTSAEFIELLNFGPGPVNIGCYIITDGDYTITIPANTILQPGDFYVLAGQSTIPAPCANIDSTITVDLNWNTCGCTSAPIPTTGDGFLTDGGTANEQVVLLDPNLKIVDAVIRNLPAEFSSPITTSSAGGCTSYTFDLDNMNVVYEILGMSAGRGNSFARRLDGDCGWVKDPQQSANATNNTSGETSDANYSLNIVNSRDCDSAHGAISISVNFTDYTEIFPMTYTLAYDTDSNGVFDFNDQYTYGVDSSAPSIPVNSMIAGNYRITLASAKGCFLHTFPFTILACYSTLPVHILYFKTRKGDDRYTTFEWLLSDVNSIKLITLEKSTDGILFLPETTIAGNNAVSGKFIKTVPADAYYKYYRLQVLSNDGRKIYSNVISTSPFYTTLKTVWPNPAQDKLNLELYALQKEMIDYKVYGLNNAEVAKGSFNLITGNNLLQLSLSTMTPGLYQIMLNKKAAGSQPISFRFVKQ